MTSPAPVQIGQTPINNVRISPGDPPIVMPSPTQPFIFAVLVVDRTVNGGLNSLTLADSLSANVQWSPDGQKWYTIAQPVWQGGILPSSTKGGVTVPHNSESVGINNGDRGFLTTDQFRIGTVTTAAVRISGTLTYYA